MAESRYLATSNYLKSLASLTPAEILHLLNKRRPANEFCDEVEILGAQAVELESVAPKKKSSKPKVATKEMRIHSMIMQIEKAMREYESLDARLDFWQIKFNVGVNYAKLEWDQIIIQHNKLSLSSESCDKIKLLICMEKGRMYNFLKTTSQLQFTWEEMCRKLGICRRSAYRYINFAALVEKFPRLLVCGLSFESLVCYEKEINKYLADHESLGDRLRVPLNGLRIQSNLNFPGNSLHRCFTEEEKFVRIDETFDWAPHFIASDELFESFLSE